MRPMGYRLNIEISGYRKTKGSL